MFGSPLFQAIPAEERTQLLSQCKWRTLKRGDALMALGTSYDWGFSLLEGFLRVECLGLKAQLVTVSVLKPDEFFVESFTQASAQACHQVTAMTAASLYQIPLTLVQQLLRDRPSLALLALDSATDRVRALRKQIARINQNESTVPLGRLLFDLATVRDDGLRLLDKRITQRDLAVMLGLSREEVNRRMKLLERKGLLSKYPEGWSVDDSFQDTDVAGLIRLETDFGDLPS